MHPAALGTQVPRAAGFLFAQSGSAAPSSKGRGGALRRAAPAFLRPRGVLRAITALRGRGPCRLRPPGRVTGRHRRQNRWSRPTRRRTCGRAARRGVPASLLLHPQRAFFLQKPSLRAAAVLAGRWPAAATAGRRAKGRTLVQAGREHGGALQKSLTAVLKHIPSCCVHLAKGPFASLVKPGASARSAWPKIYPTRRHPCWTTTRSPSS